MASSATSSSSSTKFATLPPDILAAFSSFLYAPSILRLYLCGDKALNARICMNGGVWLRFHIGGSYCFQGKGIELRGHYSPVVLNFPVEGINIGQADTTLKAAALSLNMIQYFRKLRVLSVYQYTQFRTRGASGDSLVRYIDDEIIRLLPPTLEILELRYLRAVLSLLDSKYNPEGYRDKYTFLQTSRTHSRHQEFGQVKIKRVWTEVNPWLPINELFPNLTSLAIDGSWQESVSYDNAYNDNFLSKAHNYFLAVLPASITSLAVDFLAPLNATLIPPHLGQLQTWAGHVLSSSSNTRHIDNAVLQAFPTTLMRLDLPDLELQRSNIPALPPLLTYLEVNNFEYEDAASLASYPLPNYLVRLTTSAMNSWSKSMLAAIPASLSIFVVRKCKEDELWKLSSLSVSSIRLDVLHQASALQKPKIEELEVLPPLLRHFRVFSAPAFKCLLTSPSPIFHTLQTLVLNGCHLSEDCLLALPDTLQLLECETVRTSGRLLPQDTTLVDPTTLKASITQYRKQHFPLMQSFPEISCLSVTSVPAGVQMIKVDHTTIPIDKLCSLTTINHMSSLRLDAYSPWALLAPSVTELNCRGTDDVFSDAILPKLPETLTRIANTHIALNPSSGNVQNSLASFGVLSLSLPLDLPILLCNAEHIEFVNCRFSTYKTWTSTITGLPTRLTHLRLRPTSRTRTNIGTEPTDYSLTSIFTLKFTPHIAWPATLTSITLEHGAASEFPLETLPTYLSELRILSHLVDSTLFADIKRFKRLQTLEVRGTLRINDGDLSALPPALTSINLGTSLLTLGSLPHFPSTLTSATFGRDSKVTWERIKADIEERKATDSLLAIR